VKLTKQELWSCLVCVLEILKQGLTTNYRCQTNIVHKTNSRTLALGILTNLMRSLTARFEDGYCSIIVANHQLITIFRFIAKSYTHL